MEQSLTCKWDLTCDKVRSLTSISSSTDLGVAPNYNIIKNSLVASIDI